MFLCLGRWHVIFWLHRQLFMCQFIVFLCTTKSRLHIVYYGYYIGSLKNKTFIQTGSGNKLYTESKQNTLKRSMTSVQYVFKRSLKNSLQSEAVYATLLLTSYLHLVVYDENALECRIQLVGVRTEQNDLQSGDFRHCIHKLWFIYI